MYFRLRLFKCRRVTCSEAKRHTFHVSTQKKFMSIPGQLMYYWKLELTNQIQYLLINDAQGCETEKPLSLFTLRHWERQSLINTYIYKYLHDIVLNIPYKPLSYCLRVELYQLCLILRRSELLGLKWRYGREENYQIICSETLFSS